MLRATVSALAICLLPLTAAADVAAVIVTPPDDGTDMAELPDLSPLLEEQGFEVFAATDADPEEMSATLADALAALTPGDRLLIMLAGPFARSGEAAVLLAPDAGDDLTAVNLTQRGLDLGLVEAAMARHEGQRLLLLGTVGVTERVSPAQGTLIVRPEADITVAQGPADALVRRVQSDLFTPGAALRDVFAQGNDNVRTGGYLPSLQGFGREAAAEDAAPTDTSAIEAEAWFEAASTLDTPEAYRAFLERYPDSAFAAEARAALGEAEPEAEAAPEPQPEPELPPEQIAEQTEAGLALDRDTQRSVQENLTALGYDTRGIDGIFGPGTRSALSAWQRDQALPETGFLTGTQLVTLSRQGEVRRAEIAEEEARVAAEARAEDQAFWNSTGADGSETGLRSYLDRYPSDGLFTAQARAELEEITAAQADAAERAAWDQAQAADTLEAYRSYLDTYPNGQFRDAALTRIQELTPAEEAPAEQGAEEPEQGPSDEQIATDRAQEEQVAGNAVTRLLVEQRLSQLGFAPGAVDGTFDADTRAAISAYQRDLGVAETGFISQRVLIGLIGG
ncbi:MAG: peptidoglycan-binding domain-containing protein [Shimia sp.]